MKPPTAPLQIALLVLFWTLGSAEPVKAESAEAESLRVEITDLGGCRGCAGSLERSLAKLEAVAAARLDETDPVLLLELVPKTEISVDDVRQVVRNKGYTVGRIEVVWKGRAAESEFVRDGLERTWALRWPASVSRIVGPALLRAVLVELDGTFELDVVEVESLAEQGAVEP